MSKIGLIGGTGPKSTVIYYRDIVYGVQAKTGKAFFPNMAIESLSVFDVLGYCERQDYKGLVSYLLAGIQNLEGAGVQCAALTGITPHIVFDELEKMSPIPLVSMLDTAREYAAKSGYARVGLLGTSPTMNGSFFQRAFEKRNIEVVTPSNQGKDYIGSKIETELEYGKVNPNTQKNSGTHDFRGQDSGCCSWLYGAATDFQVNKAFGAIYRCHARSY